MHLIVMRESVLYVERDTSTPVKEDDVCDEMLFCLYISLNYEEITKDMVYYFTFHGIH